MITVYVLSEDQRTVVATEEIEPACGDMCTWCGYCIHCLEALPAPHNNIQHIHYINHTREEEE